MTTTELDVGYQLPPLELPPISRTTLALFAGGSGDHNPIHIDSDFARAAGFDDVFCHGMLSMAYLGRMLTAWLPQHRIRQFSTRFAAITPVGASPRCMGSVVAISTDGEQRVASLELRVELADGTVTLLGQAEVEL
jgi:acyl dehydratase